MIFKEMCRKIADLAIMYYHYVMTQGENKFIIVIPFENSTQNEAIPFFKAALVIMVVCAVFACDKFDVFHPIIGMKEWGKKISLVKVIVFAAAVFSFHTFYKMLVTTVGGIVGADGSVRAVDCLGSFINPISIMVYAYAISTLTFRRKWFQALMLGLAIFFVPAAMTYYSFTPEHITIYLTAAAIAVTGGILYEVRLRGKCSSLVACFVLNIIYFISKYFMIFYSDRITLITAEHYFGRMKQYFACVEMDFILAFILLLFLFVYKVAITGNISIKKNAVFPGILLVFTVLSIAFGRTGLGV